MDTRTEILICKVADGCATADEERELKDMTSRDPEIARELAAQQAAVSAVRSLGLRELQDTLNEEYWGGVYNRLERRSGWALVCAGLVLVLGYGIYELLTDPGIATLYRLGIAALIVGFGLLFSGILRQHARLRRHDRYKEVIR